MKEVREAIMADGVYEHTHAELSFGAQLAWRNSPRCIGRIQWSKLQVNVNQLLAGADDRHLVVYNNW